jgi:hypothetical protein
MENEPHKTKGETIRIPGHRDTWRIIENISEGVL